MRSSELVEVRLGIESDPRKNGKDRIEQTSTQKVDRESVHRLKAGRLTAPRSGVARAGGSWQVHQAPVTAGGVSWMFSSSEAWLRTSPGSWQSPRPAEAD